MEKNEYITPTVDKGIFAKLLGDVGVGRLAFIQQLDENSADAGATEIVHTLKPNTFSVLDNGCGMDEEARGLFLSLGKSGWGSRLVKGKFGTGAKVIITVATRMTIRTVPEGTDMLCEFSCTKDDLFKAWTGSPVILTVRKTKRTPANFPYEHGTEIVIGDFIHGKIPTEKEIINGLAEYLAPYVAERVTVNGHQLKPRSIHGQRIKWQGVYEGLNIFCDLGFVQTPKKTDSPAQLGSMGPVMTLSSFIAMLSDEQRQRFPLLLSERQILGLIDVREFNQFSRHGRTQFSADILSSRELANFIDWIEIWLLPALEEAVGIVEEKSKNQRNEQILDEFCNEINQLTGPVNTGQVLSKKLAIRPSRVTLLTDGPKQIFELGQLAADGGKICWSENNLGGKLTWLDDHRLEYLPGNKVGDHFKLVVWQEKYPGIKAVAHIKLVKHKELKIHPLSTSLEPGKQSVISLVNYAQHSTIDEDWRWIVEGSGGVISSSQGTRIIYTAGKVEGDFILEAFCRTSPGKIRASCQIEISSQLDTKKPKHGSSPTIERVIRVPIGNDEVVFQLNVVNWPAISSTSTVQLGKTWHSLTINMAHPNMLNAQQRGGDVLKQVLRNEVAEQVCAILAPDKSMALNLQMRSEALKVLASPSPSE